MVEQIADGLKLWINAPHCVGRFQAEAYEYLAADGSFVRRRCGTVDGGWMAFKDAMLDAHGITVRDELKPDGIHRRMYGDDTVQGDGSEDCPHDDKEHLRLTPEVYGEAIRAGVVEVAA